MLTAKKSGSGRLAARGPHVNGAAALQRTVGNAGTARLARFLQMKSELTVGAPGDRYEREADAVAARVTAMPEAAVQRRDLEEKPIQTKAKEEEELVQTKRSSEESPGREAVSASKLHAAACPGQPLAPAARGFFEPRFGRDFGGVRVHTCDDAVGMCKGLNAQAFTYRNNIFFNRGKYEPGTPSGRKLLAHELAHTVQQGKNIHDSFVQRKYDDLTTMCITPDYAKGLTYEELERQIDTLYDHLIKNLILDPKDEFTYENLVTLENEVAGRAGKARKVDDYLTKECITRRYAERLTDKELIRQIYTLRWHLRKKPGDIYSAENMFILENELRKRKAKPSSIPINIFIQRDTETKRATFGTLTIGNQTFQTLELPWRGNKKKISRILPGSYYNAFIKKGGKLGWRIGLRNVPGNRTLIRIHRGNTPAEIWGCILPGMTRDVKNNRVNNSKGAMRAIREYIEAAGKNVTITVTIVDPPWKRQSP